MMTALLAKAHEVQCQVASGSFRVFFGVLGAVEVGTANDDGRNMTQASVEFQSTEFVKPIRLWQCEIPPRGADSEHCR
jgi:hypothetical protein